MRRFLIFLLVICAGCAVSDVQLQLGDSPVFITYSDGRTEIILQCLNLSDRIVFGITADVTIQHAKIEEIIDVIRTWIGNMDPRGIKQFSVLTDKLTFGDDVGVRAVFEYEGVK